jgi:hypothetical protein
MAAQNGDPWRSKREPKARTNKLVLLLPGLLAGFAKIVVDTTLAPLFLTGPFAVWRRTAAFVLGPDVVRLETSVPFTLDVALVGLFVHFSLSLAYASVLVILIERASRARAIGIGLAFGLALYVLNMHMLAPLFPWLADMRGLEQIISHAIFGLVVALVHIAIYPRPRLEDRMPEPQRGGQMVL